MTKRDYQHWRGFALRMARGLYKDSDSPPGAWVFSTVAWFFSTMEDGEPDLVRRIQTWEDTEASPGRDRHGGTPVCDIMSNFLEDLWDCDPDTVFPRQEREDDDSAYDRYDETWGGAVRCCVRAGLDLVSDREGVLGVTAGELRSLYPRGLPQWLLRLGWQDRQGQPVDLGTVPAADHVSL